MLSDKASSVVLGEASESDEEEFIPPRKHSSVPRPLSTSVISGEASESESDDVYNMTAEAFRSKAEEVHYNSLLHKKLKESNSKLKEDIEEIVGNIFKSATDQINEINQRLLTNQIEIQETIKYLRRSSIRTEKLDNTLSFLIAQNSFVPSFKFNT